MQQAEKNTCDIFSLFWPIEDKRSVSPDKEGDLIGIAGILNDINYMLTNKNIAL